MRIEYAMIFSMLMPGTGHIYLGKTVKGVVLMALAMIGLFVFIMPNVCDEIAWSMQEYSVVALVWIIAWMVGVVDSARLCRNQQTES